MLNLNSKKTQAIIAVVAVGFFILSDYKMILLLLFLPAFTVYHNISQLKDLKKEKVK